MIKNILNLTLTAAGSVALLAGTLQFASTTLNAGVVVPDPTFFWDFNELESGNVVKSTGSTNDMDLNLYDSTKKSQNMLGGAGSGVSGSPTDQALNLTSATGMGNSNSNAGGGASGSNMSSILGATTAVSLTISGWYYVDSTTGSTMGSNAQLVGQSNGSTNGFQFGASADGQLYLYLAGTNSRTNAKSSISDIYKLQDEWVFFAVTFDNSVSGNAVVKFYAGTSSDSVTLVSSGTANYGDFKIGTATTTIGNFPGATTYPWDGYIDNIGMWLGLTDGSGALNIDQLESLRLSQIPEPGTLAFLVLAGITFLSRRRRI